MKNTPIKEDHLYRKAYAKGKTQAGRFTVVYLLKDTANARFRRADPMHRPLNRLGLTVGKKLGGAVERNRAKRLMREAYRLTERDAGEHLSHGYLVVLAARVRINEATGPEVLADLQKSFRKLGILQAPAQTGSAP